jgi:F-type H+-transporting ATPase subunit b
VSPTLATFLFELVNFLLLTGVLGWLLFKPVRGMLQARQAGEKKQADELAARAAEADRLRAAWRQRTAAFESEVTETRAARLAAAEREAAAIVAKAREAADREHDRAARTLAHVERAQLVKLADAVAAASREAVTRLLTALDSPDLDASFVGAVCHRLKTLDAKTLGAVLVESAKPVSEQARVAITGALAARASSLTFRVVPDLGAGIRITTARGLIDASAGGLAADVERRLKDALVTEEPTVTT